MAIKIGRVEWPGPVGIGAGIIKGAGVFLDYGTKADSLEIGSITKNLRVGNEGQIVWKFAQEKGLRHNAGLPNPGAVGITHTFKDVAAKSRVPWGLSVAVSPGINDPLMAADDVADTVETVLTGGLRPDWITFNISSPDTQDPLTLLAEPKRVHQCLQAIKQVSALYNLPVWLKVSLTLTDDDTKGLCDIALVDQVGALVVGNALPDPKGNPGGWCGEPVRAHMLASVSHFASILQGKVPIVAIGGIQSGKDVVAALERGASAVQIASALLFYGREAATKIRQEYDLLNKSS